jgi:hypothetical protein
MALSTLELTHRPLGLLGCFPVAPSSQNTRLDQHVALLPPGPLPVETCNRLWSRLPTAARNSRIVPRSGHAGASVAVISHHPRPPDLPFITLTSAPRRSHSAAVRHAFAPAPVAYSRAPSRMSRRSLPTLQSIRTLSSTIRSAHRPTSGRGTDPPLERLRARTSACRLSPTRIRERNYLRADAFERVRHPAVTANISTRGGSHVARVLVRTTAAAVLLVSGTLVLGGCALTSGIPGGSSADSSTEGIGSGTFSSSQLGGPSPIQRFDKIQSP